MRESIANTTRDAQEHAGTQVEPGAVPASYDEFYAAEDYMAIIDAAFGPEEPAVQPALH